MKWLLALLWVGAAEAAGPGDRALDRFEQRLGVERPRPAYETKPVRPPAWVRRPGGKRRLTCER